MSAREVAEFPRPSRGTDDFQRVVIEQEDGDAQQRDGMLQAGEAVFECGIFGFHFVLHFPSGGVPPSATH